MLSKPSFMTAPRVNSRSSAWLRTALSNIRQYSIARRMISELTTGEPSSVKATAPPSTRPPISASSSPLRSLVMAPMGKTLALPAALGLQIDELGGRLAVDGRLGVGHARDAGDAARQCRGRAGGDGLVLLAARLAQVDVHVDQPRADDLAAGVDGAVGVQVRPGADGENAAVLKPDVGDLVDALRRIDDPAVGDAKDVHAEDCTRRGPEEEAAARTGGERFAVFALAQTDFL